MAYPSTYEYRMMRLEHIRSKLFNGNNKEMAEAAGLKETHLSSYISGRAKLGSKLARTIEANLKIRENELDQPIFNGTTYEALLEIKEIVDKGFKQS